MIFSFDGSVAYDGSCSEIGVDLMNALRTFIWSMPDEYLNEFIPHLYQDLADKKSYLYLPSEQITDDLFWFEVLGDKNSDAG